MCIHHCKKNLSICSVLKQLWEIHPVYCSFMESGPPLDKKMKNSPNHVDLLQVKHISANYQFSKEGKSEIRESCSKFIMKRRKQSSKKCVLKSLWRDGSKIYSVGFQQITIIACIIVSSKLMWNVFAYSNSIKQTCCILSARRMVAGINHCFQRKSYKF